MRSNRFTVVDREIISGSIEGVDFGPAMQVIARSPDAVLLWNLAHSYSINGFRHYADPSLFALPNRRKPIGGWLKYERLLEGGRLSLSRIHTVSEKIIALFDEGAFSAIVDAVRLRKTLLIEGGGPPLRPAPRLGMAAYSAWQEVPKRGFLNLNEDRPAAPGKSGG